MFNLSKRIMFPASGRQRDFLLGLLSSWCFLVFEYVNLLFWLIAWLVRTQAFL